MSKTFQRADNKSHEMHGIKVIEFSEVANFIFVQLGLANEAYCLSSEIDIEFRSLF
jgi:hypothetical protein